MVNALLVGNGDKPTNQRTRNPKEKDTTQAHHEMATNVNNQRFVSVVVASQTRLNHFAGSRKTCSLGKSGLT